MHPLAQWRNLADAHDATRPSPFLQAPRKGGLPGPQFAALCRLLAGETETSSQSFAGLWEGYAPGLAPKLAFELSLDQRMFLMWEEAIANDGSLLWRAERTSVVESPTILWPHDHAWFVASDPDLDSTYVGGTGTLIEKVLKEASLEAWPIIALDLVTIDSDVVNRGD
jgi:hypothetical protein